MAVWGLQAQALRLKVGRLIILLRLQAELPQVLIGVLVGHLPLQAELTIIEHLAGGAQSKLVLQGLLGLRLRFDALANPKVLHQPVVLGLLGLHGLIHDGGIGGIKATGGKVADG